MRNFLACRCTSKTIQMKLLGTKLFLNVFNFTRESCGQLFPPRLRLGYLSRSGYDLTFVFTFISSIRKPDV